METNLNSQGAAHTPGPWHVAGLSVYAKPSYGQPFYGRLRDYRNPICLIDGDRMSETAELLNESETGAERQPGWAEACANANLIAAAPDLLTALEPLARLYSGQITNTGEYYPQLFDAARAAIAKAKGTK